MFKCKESGNNPLPCTARKRKEQGGCGNVQEGKGRCFPSPRMKGEVFGKVLEQGNMTRKIAAKEETRRGQGGDKAPFL